PRRARSGTPPPINHAEGHPAAAARLNGGPKAAGIASGSTRPEKGTPPMSKSHRPTLTAILVAGVAAALVARAAPRPHPAPPPGGAPGSARLSAPADGPSPGVRLCAVRAEARRIVARGVIAGRVSVAEAAAVFAAL